MADSISDGQRESFEREALPHLDAVYRRALRLTNSAADADDLVQETMMRAYRFWHQYQPGTNAKAWLLTILRTTFINEYRHRTRRRETFEREVEPFIATDDTVETDPENDFFDGLVDDEVTRAVAALPPAYREVVELTDVEGMRYEESARILGVPVGTIKSRLFRARRILRAQLLRYAVSTGWVEPPTDVVPAL
jgi:RNA polymerase sigma-70 factor (ECF subfamily)